MKESQSEGKGVQLLRSTCTGNNVDSPWRWLRSREIRGVCRWTINFMSRQQSHSHSWFRKGSHYGARNYKRGYIGCLLLQATPRCRYEVMQTDSLLFIVSLCYCVVVLLCCCVIVLLCHCVYCVIVSLCYCVEHSSLICRVIVSVCYCVEHSSLIYCVIVLLRHCVYCVVVLLCWAFEFEQGRWEMLCYTA